MAKQISSLKTKFSKSKTMTFIMKACIWSVTIYVNNIGTNLT